MTGVSELGLKVGDGRLRKVAGTEDTYAHLGFTTRSGGGFGPALFFDVVDSLLIYQGYLDSTARLIRDNNIKVVFAHSLGAMSQNLLAQGSGNGNDIKVLALPFLHAGAMGVQVWSLNSDLITGGFLSAIFTPDTNLISGPLFGHSTVNYGIEAGYITNEGYFNK